MRPEGAITLENLDMLVEQHKGFIIRTVSSMTGRYVSVEHDDTFIIALEGFAEAVDRYDGEKGSFLSFAKLVMESRLKNYFAKENKGAQMTSLDSLYENGIDFCNEADEEEKRLREEISDYINDLSYFGLTMDILADTAPKHKDTRDKALFVAETASEDEPTVDATYKKKRLPIRAVAQLAGVTEKIVKGSRHFILAAMVIFVKKYPALSTWVRKAGGEKNVF